MPLLAVRGKWNTASGAFERSSQALTFACAPTFSGMPRSLRLIKPITGEPGDQPSDLDQADYLGVLSKCYFWGFAQPKETEDSRFASYQACLRAARAEYCGRGISQTEQNTIIQIYEPAGSRVNLPIRVPLAKPYCAKLKDPKSSKRVTERKVLDNLTPCFEALWDNDGAICVSHARFEEMPAQDCKSTFNNEFTAVVGHGEARVFPKTKADEPVYLNCQINDYQVAVQRARVKNRSFINRLNGEVKSCVNDIPCP